jgi:hypothetical protein
LVAIVELSESVELTSSERSHELGIGSRRARAPRVGRPSGVATRYHSVPTVAPTTRPAE